MAQLSRPYQIALAALALLGLVWAVALRGHAPASSESTGSVPSTPAPAANAKAEEKAAAGPTQIYHGAAPGVEGLSRAIAKAHEAVASTQQNAQQLQQRSREASQETPSSANSADSAAASPAPSATGHARGSAAIQTRATAVHAHRSGARPSAAGKRGTTGRPAEQVAVEREVAAGKTVLLLLWTPGSSVDREVRSETAAMVARSHGKLALHVGTPGQVGEFGSVTEVIHIYQTPTILIVNRRGIVSTLTGLTDTFALGQIVREAERAND